MVENHYPRPESGNPEGPPVKSPPRGIHMKGEFHWRLTGVGGSPRRVNFNDKRCLPLHFIPTAPKRETLAHEIIILDVNCGHNLAEYLLSSIDFALNFIFSFSYPLHWMADFVLDLD